MLFQQTLPTTLVLNPISEVLPVLTVFFSVCTFTLNNTTHKMNFIYSSLFFFMSFGKNKAVAKVVTDVVAHFGSLAVLVNNAGVCTNL